MKSFITLLILTGAVEAHGALVFPEVVTGIQADCINDFNWLRAERTALGKDPDSISQATFDRFMRFCTNHYRKKDWQLSELTDCAPSEDQLAWDYEIHFMPDCSLALPSSR